MDSNFAVDEFRVETFVVPSNLLDAVAEPRESTPVVRLPPILNVDVERFACIELTNADDIIIESGSITVVLPEKLIVLKKEFTHAVVAILEELSVEPRPLDVIIGCDKKVVTPLKTGIIYCKYKFTDKICLSG